MNTTPRRFILQALDPDHGSPVLETLFLVERLDDLRILLGSSADDDPELLSGYDLGAAHLTAIADRFGVTFDPGGREIRLRAWSSTREAPYLIHTGYELPLLLQGRKPFAYFRDSYPPTATLAKTASTAMWPRVFCTRRWSLSLLQNQPALRLAKSSKAFGPPITRGPERNGGFQLRN